MREIKFRAYIYDLTDEDSHPLEIDVRAGKLWDVASINFKDKIVEIMDDDGNVWEYELKSNKIALLQYTGLKDQNDAEIHESYIVKFDPQSPCGDEFYNPRDGEIGEVILDCGSFVVRPIDKKREGLHFSLSELGDWVVVGNIYENPELLQ